MTKNIIVSGTYCRGTRSWRLLRRLSGWRKNIRCVVLVDVDNAICGLLYVVCYSLSTWRVVLCYKAHPLVTSHLVFVHVS